MSTPGRRPSVSSLGRMRATIVIDTKPSCTSPTFRTLCAFRYNQHMRSSDLLIAGRRRAGLSQEQLAQRLGRPQSTIARWETGHQHPPLESVLDALHACDLELTVGLPRYDDSYHSQIARQLRLEPGERLSRMAPAWATEGFDPIGMLSELAGQARFVVIGNVAGALHGWPILLGGRTLHIVPAETAMPRVEQTARRLGAEPAELGDDAPRRWVLPSGAELHATLVPPGTRGYRDLARDAQSMQIAPGVSVSVASLIDLIRIAESSPDPDARMFVSALWATLEMRQRKAQDTTKAGHGSR
jgi:transcriptional regulator with XRE-family HTH domain